MSVSIGAQLSVVQNLRIRYRIWKNQCLGHSSRGALRPPPAPSGNSTVITWCLRHSIVLGTARHSPGFLSNPCPLRFTRESCLSSPEVQTELHRFHTCLPLSSSGTNKTKFCLSVCLLATYAHQAFLVLTNTIYCFKGNYLPWESFAHEIISIVAPDPTWFPQA